MNHWTIGDILEEAAAIVSLGLFLACVAMGCALIAGA